MKKKIIRDVGILAVLIIAALLFFVFKAINKKPAIDVSFIEEDETELIFSENNLSIFTQGDVLEKEVSRSFDDLLFGETAKQP